MLLECKTTNNQNSCFFGESGKFTIRSSMFDLFTAGMETLSTSVLMLLLQLLHHTDFQDKIQEEIDDVSGGCHVDLAVSKIAKRFTRVQS